MNKKAVSLVCAAFAAVLVLTSPVWHWFLKEPEKQNMLIVNKTAGDETLREHKGVIWLLNHMKKIKEDGSAYHVADDYTGYVPASKSIRELPSDLSNYSHLYLADSYGVYADEEDESDEMIYGGMTAEEAGRIEQSVKTNGQTIFAEFNTLAEPTEPDARRKLEELFGLKWTGWTGRFFLDLGSDEVPGWVKKAYETEYLKTYRFDGKGLIFVSEKEGLLIFTEEDFKEKHPISFSFNERGEKEFGSAGKLNYNYWFDIIEPAENTGVLAQYKLHLNSEAEEKLKGKGVPLTMPAVLHHEDSSYQAYYFAGDYADAPDIPGFYQASGITQWKKLTSSDKKGRTDGFFWKAYVPMMEAIIEKEKDNSEKKSPKHEAAVVNGTKLTARTGADRIQIYKDGSFQDMLVKGVNMGIAKPGSFPGETAITKSEYARWIRQIGEMNANAIRIYTIHPPAFYEALFEYNQKAENPIYLFHGVWAEEEQLLEKKDAYHPKATEDFKEEVKRIIDLVHGNAKLAERPGHAYGEYTADISPYVIGWILGVEWDPEVVAETNKKHPDKSSYEGTYIESEKAEPFEVWLAEMMNYTIDYEQKNYQWTRPVSFTNWVTTDLLSHPSEPLEKEDMVSLNPNVMKPSDAYQAGIFASYHIYPYYPDFLNLEEKYVNYEDERGEKNNYAGYLADLKDHHQMPVLAAEFGIPASRGMTHKNVHGKHQGYHSEQEQGKMVSELYEDIVHENFAGGLVFSWQDEWFKRTWNTMDYDNPDRRPMWDNVQTNEQNFGLLDFRPGSKETVINIDGKTDDWDAGKHTPAYKDADGLVKEIYISSDEQGISIRMDLQKDQWYNRKLSILFDTVPKQGQIHPPDQTSIKTEGVDFTAEINPSGESRLLIDSYYDTFYYHYGHQLRMIPSAPYANRKNNGIYHPVRLTLNKNLTITTESGKKDIPFSSYETGILQKGNGNPDDPSYTSLADYEVNTETGTAEIRIPWMLLNMKDPSTREAMGDFWTNGIESSVKTDGINLAFLLTDAKTGKVKGTVPELKQSTLPKQNWLPYTWNEWEEPIYHERLKKSYRAVQKTYKEMK